MNELDATRKKLGILKTSTESKITLKQRRTLHIEHLTLKYLKFVSFLGIRHLKKYWDAQQFYNIL